MKKLHVIGILMAMTLMLTSCGNKSDDVSVKNDGTLSVVTSFYGIKALTEEIGGDKVTIKNIIPEGTEPHDFEPKAKDMKAIEEADVFIYNGAGMEEWIDAVKASISNKELLMVEASNGVDFINIDETSEESEHNHSGKDPHTWLGLTSSKVEAKNIKNALVEKDPTNRDYYEANYEAFQVKIDSVIDEYTPKFKALKNKDFVTGHATFGYLCKDLGLIQNSIEGVFAEGEPSPKELENLIEHCKENNIKAIFVEELVNQELSNTLAKEVGVETKQIYTLHSSEDGKSFSDALKYDVETIYDTISKIK